MGLEGPAFCRAFAAAFFAPLPHAQLHQRLVVAAMQIFGMAESSHGQTTGLHPSHKRVLFVPRAAIDQILRGFARESFRENVARGILILLCRGYR
jgi:hypothetical protein